MLPTFLIASLSNVQEPLTVRMPPPSVTSRAWLLLANEAPLSSDFCKGSLKWEEGAYYLHIRAHNRDPIKLMIYPPRNGDDWGFKLLTSSVRSSKAVDAKGLKKPPMSWTKLFAESIFYLPTLFENAQTFQVRVIPENGKLLCFFEKTPPPSWVLFTLS